MGKKLAKKRKRKTVDKGLLGTAEDIPPAVPVLTPEGVALAPPPEAPEGERPEDMHIDDLQRAVMGAGFTFKKHNRTHYAVQLPGGDLVDFVRMPWRSALVEVMHKHILKDAK